MKVIDKLRAGQSVRRDEVNRFLDWAIYRVRVRLDAAVKVPPDKFRRLDADAPTTIQNSDLEGLCGDAQCILAYGLDGLKVPSHKIAMQSMPQSCLQHVALTLEFLVEGERKLFLLDPTFRQFCNPNKKRDDFGYIPAGFFLAEMPNGSNILNKLLSDGWIELSPAAAHQYLAAFNKGKSCFSDPAKAFDFMRHPPKHKCNLYRPRSKVESLAASY